LWAFVCDYGHAVMLAGLAIILGAGLVLIANQKPHSPLRSVVWPCVAVGVCVYVAGRAGVAFRSRRPKSTDELDDTKSS
jgi:hypothetical protein